MTASNWLYFLLGAGVSCVVFTAALWLYSSHQEATLRRRIAELQKNKYETKDHEN